jgi:hypothetical protein
MLMDKLLVLEVEVVVVAILVVGSMMYISLDSTDSYLLESII